MMRRGINRLCGRVVESGLRVAAMLFACCLCLWGSIHAQDTGEYDTPILEVPEDVCEVEITPEMVDMLLYDPKTFYTLVIPAPCEPPPPTQYKCKGCRDKNATVYECFHVTMDPSIPCSENEYIKNVVKVKSCYVSDSGLEDCRVLFDPAGDPEVPERNWKVQYRIRLPTGVRCHTNSQNPEIWFKSYEGCPNCIEVRYFIRCRASAEVCRLGEIIDISFSPGRYLCSPRSCPHPR